jgi:hypothetical protein
MDFNTPKFSLVKFRTLIRDARGPTQAVNEVLHTQEELDEYVDSFQDQHEPSHAVAFPEERAIAVALGSRSHGYSVEIIAVVQETGGFAGVQHHVLYIEHIPHGSHGSMTDAPSFPQHVIRLRGLSGIVSFSQVPDWIGQSLHALIGTLASTDRQPLAAPTNGHSKPGQLPHVVGDGPPAVPQEIQLTRRHGGEQRTASAVRAAQAVHAADRPSNDHASIIAMFPFLEFGHAATTAPTESLVPSPAINGTKPVATYHGVKQPARLRMDPEPGSSATLTAMPSRMVELPMDGQGTISVEVAHFELQPERYVIALADAEGSDVFRIVVRDQSVAIEVIEDGVPSVGAATATTPFISFPASSMVIWVSVDRSNRRISFGQGYMMRRNEVVSIQLPEQPGLEHLALTKLCSPSRVREVHHVVFDDAIQFYHGRAPRVNLMPVVLDAPPTVVERDAITLEDLARNDRMPASTLPHEAQVLWGAASGARIAISQSDADAINYSLDTKGKTLYEIVQRKRKEAEFGDPNMVYVRVTIGPPRGDSPGVPFVMEIWPKNSYSPVHNHGNTVAIIKVLHGSISSSWFGPLADKDNPEPRRFAEHTFYAGDATWMTPEMYQTHQLRNPRSDTACITIQCYRYLNRDDVHHEFFDYLAPGGGVRRFFEPNSDIEYLDLIQRVRAEYEEATAGMRKKIAGKVAG